MTNAFVAVPALGLLGVGQPLSSCPSLQVMKEKIPCGVGMDLMVRAAVNREAWALRAVVGAEPSFQVDVVTDSEFFKKCLYPFEGKGVAPGEA